MKRKSRKKRRSSLDTSLQGLLKKKNTLVIALLVVFVLYYIGFSLTEDSAYDFSVDGPISVAIVSPGAPVNLRGQRVQIMFMLKPEKVSFNVFRPLTETELVIGTHLVNANVTIMYDNANYAPVEYRARTYYDPVIHAYRFALPLKNIPITVKLSGTVPDVYNKEITFVHAVQRNSYLFYSKDIFLVQNSQFIE
jgi:hypothetical protein